VACCRCCCGGADCAEGQAGKCCCGNTCCQVGEFCCDGVCQPEPCEEPTGACCVALDRRETYGECVVTTEADCTATYAGTYLGDNFSCGGNRPGYPPGYPCVECRNDGECPEGKYCCSGYCVDTPCYSCKTYAVSGCPSISNVAICESAASPFSFGTCDPTRELMRTTPPYLGTRDCSSGTTVTVSGYVDPSSDPVFKAWVEGIINNSWYVPFNCLTPSGGLFYYEPYPVTPPNPPVSFPVFVQVNYNYVSVGVRSSTSGGGVWFAIVETSGLGPQRRTTNTACAPFLFPCEAFDGTFPGSSATYSVT
jgi:hypothetical protein